MLRSLLQPPALILFGLLPATGMSASGLDWTQLIEAGDFDTASKVCATALEVADAGVRAEAHKCLANVALADADEIHLASTDDGGARIRGGLRADAVERALEHLDRALDLAPQDLSIHQGRLHVLMMAGRHADTAPALRDSLERYEADGLDHWLDYAPRFYSEGEYRAAVEFLSVLEARYPRDHRVAANLGAFYALLEEDDKALPYARRAVELEPNDVRNNWNLGRLYDYRDELKPADHYYGRALALDPDGSAGSDPCTYANFIEERLGDPARACLLRKNSCTEDHRSRCR